MKISIVIPVYNEAKTLHACLESIANQTAKPYEVIVVDNNSTDSSLGIAKQFDFVTILKEPRQGIVYARNRGFNAATGGIIARIDADTILPAAWIQTLISLYENAGKPDLMAVTASSDFRNLPRFLWRVLHKLTYFWPSRLLLGHNTLVGSNMFITKTIWELVKNEVCVRNDVHEDMDLACHIGQTGTPILIRKEMKASVLARQMSRRFFSYPTMMLKIKFINH